MFGRVERRNNDETVEKKGEIRVEGMDRGVKNWMEIVMKDV